MSYRHLCFSICLCSPVIFVHSYLPFECSLSPITLLWHCCVPVALYRLSTLLVCWFRQFLQIKHNCQSLGNFQTPPSWHAPFLSSARCLSVAISTSKPMHTHRAHLQKFTQIGPFWYCHFRDSHVLQYKTQKNCWVNPASVLLYSNMTNFFCLYLRLIPISKMHQKESETTRVSKIYDNFKFPVGA